MKRHQCWLPAVGVAHLALAGCASAPRGRPAVDTTEPPEAAPSLSQARANNVTLYAIALVGTPYRYGVNTPETGFDCSGLIKHVYRATAKLAPPRTAGALLGWGWPISSEHLHSGDLVILAAHGAVRHAGIYVGGGRFVRAPTMGGVVRLEALESGYRALRKQAFASLEQ